MAVDDDPAALAAVPRDERSSLLVGPDVRARSIKRVTSTGAQGSKRVASPEKIAAAAAYLTSDDADYIHATALHIERRAGWPL